MNYLCPIFGIREIRGKMSCIRKEELNHGWPG